MRFLRLFIAFTLGALLYQVAVVYVGGTLAAVAIPKSYFDWFGRSNIEVGLALLQLATFALPIAILVAGGVLAAHRVLAGSTRSVLMALLAGLAACFLLWVVVVSANFPSPQAGEPNQSGVMVRQLLLQPWWALSGFLAPWVGYSLAAWMLVRKARRAV
ncbi:hypothetical protein LNV09_24620 [Paucibacter sp. B2R-40]|uniref:hypothetical protein n=1 Tax=Paucibacter sp. B2R-40 TaxID=2893554 RepID=UPI0021E4C846|nr:hypothetical protein [Paucibacter sp. B2R-40]MCV2357337.1 hypothetical protein [Paucibacter sp. B2R-40]